MRRWGSKRQRRRMAGVYPSILLFVEGWYLQVSLPFFSGGGGALLSPERAAVPTEVGACKGEPGLHTTLHPSLAAQSSPQEPNTPQTPGSRGRGYTNTASLCGVSAPTPAVAVVPPRYSRAPSQIGSETQKKREKSDLP